MSPLVVRYGIGVVYICFAGVLTRLQSACLGEQGAPIGGLYLAGRRSIVHKLRHHAQTLQKPTITRFTPCCVIAQLEDFKASIADVHRHVFNLCRDRQG